MMGFSFSPNGIHLFDPPVEAGEPFVTPEIVSWEYLATGDTNSLVMMQNNVTSGTPCKIIWTIYNPALKVSYNFPITANFENSPHAEDVTISNPLHRGKYYDLRWRWVTDDDFGPVVTVAVSGIYIPSFGEPDSGS